MIITLLQLSMWQVEVCQNDLVVVGGGGGGYCGEKFKSKEACFDFKYFFFFFFQGLVAVYILLHFCPMFF